MCELREVIAVFCQRCGAQNPDDAEARFCRACGAPLPAVGQDAASPEPVAGAAPTPGPASTATTTPPNNGTQVPQPVTPYAGFWIRLAAYLIDGLILSTVGSIVGGTIGGAVGGLMALSSTTGGSDEAAVASVLGLTGVLMLVSVAIGAAYYIVLPVVAGATPGKLIVGLEIVNADFRRIGYGSATLRWLGYIVSGIVLYIGFVWIGVDDRKQGWHDKLASTYVVRKAFVRR